VSEAYGTKTAVALGGGLNEVDEVAAGVLEKDGSNGAHALWFAAKDDTERFQAAVLGGDVVGHEGRGGNAGGEESFLKSLRRRETHGLED